MVSFVRSWLLAWALSLGGLAAVSALLARPDGGVAGAMAEIWGQFDAISPIQKLTVGAVAAIAALALGATRFGFPLRLIWGAVALLIGFFVADTLTTDTPLLTLDNALPPLVGALLGGFALSGARGGR